MSVQYLCYDVKGIQQFIFSVPRLRYVVGASLLIDDFDLEAAKENKIDSGVKAIYCGGGKGCLRCCSEESADSLRRRLVARAHDLGLDLRIGAASTFLEAATCADDLYPYAPSSLKGKPCPVSGLWPTENGEEHPVVKKRAEFAKDRGKRKLDARVFDALKNLQDAPDELNELLDYADAEGLEVEFMTAARWRRAEDEETRLCAKAADVALGARNRWAIVSMDGNDVGSQFRAFKGTDEELERWVERMSLALKTTTRDAFCIGLASQIAEWWKIYRNSAAYLELCKAYGSLILPFRPLILGGDDVLCLCPCMNAMDLARRISSEFSELSQQAAEEAKKDGFKFLWPGTNDRLTIDAGIAFCSTGLPLSEAIPYAEELLASAKGKFRNDHNDGEPSPAAIDWESVTESTLDSPRARRNRELRFIDSDLDGEEVELTARPMRLDAPGAGAFSLDEVYDLAYKLQNAPASILETYASILRRPYAERQSALLAYAKRRKAEWLLLNEGIETEYGVLSGFWRKVDVETDEGTRKKRVCCFQDAFDLIREIKRMGRTTI